MYEEPKVTVDKKEVSNPTPDQQVCVATPGFGLVYAVAVAATATVAAQHTHVVTK